MLFAMGFGDGLKKRKPEEMIVEANPSLPLPQMPIVNAEPTNTEAQKAGDEGTTKTKKRMKTAGKKTLQVESTLYPIGPETRIIEAVEKEASLFTI